MQLELGDQENYQRMSEIIFPQLPCNYGPMIPFLDRAIPTLKGSFLTFLSGSGCELFIRPPYYTCLNDLDLMCVRRDCEAAFENDWLPKPVDVSHERKSVKTFRIKQLFGREVLLHDQCNSILENILYEEFKKCTSSTPRCGIFESCGKF